MNDENTVAEQQEIEAEQPQTEAKQPQIELETPPQQRSWWERFTAWVYRPSRKWTDMLVLTLLAVVLVQVLGYLVTAVLHRVIPIEAFLDSLTGDNDVTIFLLQYFSFIGIWVVFFLLCLLFKANRPMLRALSFKRPGNSWRSIFMGLLLGGGLNGLCVLLSWLHGDIKLSYNAFDPLLLILFLVCVAIQSGGEEVLCRCYQYQKLRRRFRWPAVAILGNALLFMALHMANPGVTALGLLEVFLIGLLFSLIVYYYDSLGTVIWAHAFWNYSQSIVFGLPNSGIVSKYSLFRLDAATARDGLFYNTSFGVEGSLGGNVLILLVILWILFRELRKKTPERMDYWKALEEQCRDKRRRAEGVWIVLTYVLAGLLVFGFFRAPSAQTETGVQQEIETDAAADPAQ